MPFAPPSTTTCITDMKVQSFIPRRMGLSSFIPLLLARFCWVQRLLTCLYGTLIVVSGCTMMEAASATSLVRNLIHNESIEWVSTTSFDMLEPAGTLNNFHTLDGLLTGLNWICRDQHDMSKANSAADIAFLPLHTCESNQPRIVDTDQRVFSDQQVETRRYYGFDVLSMVLTPLGPVPIATLSAGDIILSFNFELGEVEFRQMSRKLVTTEYRSIALVRTESCSLLNSIIGPMICIQTTIKCGASQLFWSVSSHKWVEAQYLRPDEALHSPSQNVRVQVIQVSLILDNVTWINIEVDFVHNFYVAAASIDAELTFFLVHNNIDHIWEYANAVADANYRTGKATIQGQTVNAAMVQFGKVEGMGGHSALFVGRNALALEPAARKFAQSQAPVQLNHHLPVEFFHGEGASKVNKDNMEHAEVALFKAIDQYSNEHGLFPVSVKLASKCQQ